MWVHNVSVAVGNLFWYTGLKIVIKKVNDDNRNLGQLNPLWITLWFCVLKKYIEKREALFSDPLKTSFGSDLYGNLFELRRKAPSLHSYWLSTRDVVGTSPKPRSRLPPMYPIPLHAWRDKTVKTGFSVSYCPPPHHFRSQQAGRK